MDTFFHVRIWAVPLCVLVLVSVTSVANGQTVTVTEINPTRANTIDGRINAGRVNHLARATNSVFYAASEFGGLFKTIDAGRTWTRLDAHLPTRVSDVKASPANPNLIIATSLYDGRVSSFAGINVSRDGGASWSRPPSSRPPSSSCPDSTTLNEHSAFGIAFDPASPAHIFVGTNCGLAKSTDSGLNWTFINSGPGVRATSVFGIVVHHGGIIDTCGSGGHRRSTDGGANWVGPQSGGTPLPKGNCSIAASPDESSVLFATAGTKIFETDNGGRSWDTEFVNPESKGRVPFVVTNDREGRNFDLWFGDATLKRAGCRTPAIPGPIARCPTSSAWIPATTGAHGDMGEVVFTKPPIINVTACRQACSTAETACESKCDELFDSCMADVGEPGGPLKSQCVNRLAQCTSKCTSSFNACNTNCNAQDGCPILVSDDGGTFFNALTQSPSCQTPQWTHPTATIRALWLWSLSGANIANSLSREAVYMGTQDNGAFVTLNAGAATPTWTNPAGGDVPDVVSDSTQVVFTVWNQTSRIFLRNPNLIDGQGKIPNPPPGEIIPMIFPDIIARFGARRYGVATSSGIFVTQNISANPIRWTPLGTNAPIVTAGLWAAGPPTNPTFYAMTANHPTLMRYKGLSTTATWQSVPLPSGFRSVGAFGVDPNNPNRLFISAFVTDFITLTTRVQMFRSSDGGANWAPDVVLDRLMNGGGTFRMQVQTLGYLQPTLAVFDPNNPNTLLAGSADAGIFLSRNNGASWTTVTNNSGDAANPIIPRPYWAYFDRECGQNNIYVGTQGRGAWRFSYRDTEGTTVSSCQARCDSSLPECQSKCDESHLECLAETGPNKTPPFQCAAARNTCRASCSTTRNVCRQRCIDCPQKSSAEGIIMR
jgi:photosystem II stability/assembly factor-like uncharacterized protein